MTTSPVWYVIRTSPHYAVTIWAGRLSECLDWINTGYQGDYTRLSVASHPQGDVQLAYIPAGSRAYALLVGAMPWKARENHRQQTRTMPVWEQCPWWQDAQSGVARGHYVHVSASDPRLIAYTQSPEKGERDIQTPIKPGKYLAKYFSDVLTEKQIRFYANWQSSGKRPDGDQLEVKFATTREDIARVYRDGPDSCMSGDSFDTECHPCEVYAAGDLAVAYTEDEGGTILARALCWPEKEVYGRVYPTPGRAGTVQEDHDHLLDALASRGWVDYKAGGSFNGARLLRIEHSSDSLVMPYLDGDYRFNDYGNYLEMTHHGEHGAQDTSGYVSLYEATCDRCGEGMHEGEGYAVYTDTDRHGNGRRGQTWCEYCEDNYSFRCEGTDEYFSDSVDSVDVDGCTYTRAYADRYFEQCALTGDWISDDDNSVTMANGDIWSEGAFEDHGFVCKSDGENYPLAEMHPDYEGYHKDTHPDDLPEGEPDRTTVQQGRVEDARQGELV